MTVQEEFRSDDKFSTVPDSNAKGKTVKLPKDKTQGNKEAEKLDDKNSRLKAKKEVADLAARLKTKTGMMNEIIRVMGNLKKEEVEEIHSALTEDEDEELDDTEDELTERDNPFEKKDKGDDDDDSDDDSDDSDDDDGDDDSGDDDDEDEVVVKVQKKEAKKVTKEDIDIDYDVAGLFEGTDLTDDFKGKVTGLLETTVLTIVNENLKAMYETQQAEMVEEVEAMQEELTDTVDEYLSHVVEQWMEDNELAIESGLRLEIAEEFIGGLRDLFAENFIDVPDEKTDLVDELANKVESLEEDLNKEIHANISLKEEVEQVKRQEVMDSVLEGDKLTDSQKEKIISLAENVDYEDADEFKGKVEELTETFFGEGLKVQTKDTSEDDGTVLTTEEQETLDPLMQAVVVQLKNVK